MEAPSTTSEAGVLIPQETLGVEAGNIPERLKERPQWICWRYEVRSGEPTKMPYTPSGGGRRANSADLMTWRPFEVALAAYEHERSPYHGIGYVFCDADPFTGIDLDKCRDPETGVMEGWAMEIVEIFNDVGHVELSPSGTGIHIIVEGDVPQAEKGERIEVYARRRYFATTGVLL
jgi:putative DNA primase/helicase